MTGDTRRPVEHRPEAIPAVASRVILHPDPLEQPRPSRGSLRPTVDRSRSRDRPGEVYELQEHFASISGSRRADGAAALLQSLSALGRRALRLGLADGVGMGPFGRAASESATGARCEQSPVRVSAPRSTVTIASPPERGPVDGSMPEEREGRSPTMPTTLSDSRNMAASVDSAILVTTGSTVPSVRLPEANRTAAAAVASVHARPGVPAVAENDVLTPRACDTIGPMPRPGQIPDRNRSRPRCNRTCTVPSGQPSSLSGLHLGPPLQVTEDDRSPVFLGSRSTSSCSSA